MGLTLLQDFN